MQCIYCAVIYEGKFVGGQFTSGYSPGAIHWDRSLGTILLKINCLPVGRQYLAKLKQEQ